MAKLTPQEYVEKQARNLKNSVPDIRAGIARVTVAPGSLAVEKEDKMRTKLLESLDSGRWRAATGAVSLQDWKTAALDKGVDRIASGIDKAKTKNVRMAANLLAAVDDAVAQIENMPSDTLEDSIGRMSAYVRLMAEKKGTIKV